MKSRLLLFLSALLLSCNTDYTPKVQEGDFYIFPYDMRHCVYPFNGTKEKRRTLVCNCDVDYNPVSSRTAAGQLE